jgi:hypothetical protein
MCHLSFRKLSGFGKELLHVLQNALKWVDEISIGSGVRGTTVMMKTAVLRQALGDIEVVNLKE